MMSDVVLEDGGKDDRSSRKRGVLIRDSKIRRSKVNGTGTSEGEKILVCAERKGRTVCGR